MSSSPSSRDENQHSHRQGSVTSLPDDDDQRTLASEPSVALTRQRIVSPSVNVELRTASRLSNNEDKTSQADSHEDVTRSFETVDRTNDNYETLVRSQQLFFDPDPDIIRKPQMIKPLIYRQNISIKFLKPPPLQQEPLIIREVRPPQPPPPPPLVSPSGVRPSPPRQLLDTD